MVQQHLCAFRSRVAFLPSFLLYSLRYVSLSWRFPASLDSFYFGIRVLVVMGSRDR